MQLTNSKNADAGLSFFQAFRNCGIYKKMLTLFASIKLFRLDCSGPTIAGAAQSSAQTSPDQPAPDQARSTW
jgi:hypothetical protein